MRERLQRFDGERMRFRARIERFGKKNAYRGKPKPTVLFVDVQLARSGQPVTEHLWFTCGKWSETLAVGDTIEFDARVGDYVKGYRGWDETRAAENPPTRDYRLQHPTRVVKVDNTPQLMLPIT